MAGKGLGIFHPDSHFLCACYEENIFTDGPGGTLIGQTPY